MPEIGVGGAVGGATVVRAAAVAGEERSFVLSTEFSEPDKRVGLSPPACSAATATAAALRLASKEDMKLATGVVVSTLLGMTGGL